ncbi:MAG: M1 family metallopeptidase [Chitinophagales bacterium]
MKRILTTLFITFYILSFAHGDDEFGCIIRDKKGHYREHNVGFLKMTLDISFDVMQQEVYGNIIYDFIPLQKEVDTLFLDAPHISFQSVSLDGEVLPFYTNEEGIVLQFPATLSWEKEYKLKMEYTAHPKKGIYFMGWDDETDRLRKQIWTQGQGIDNRHWIPGFDGVTDKLITETNITFDKGYEVVSNGAFVDKTDNQDGTTTWQYAMNEPHVMYLIMIAIGEYEYKDMKSASGVISRQYYYGDKPETFAPTYQYSVEMMDWMEAEFGVDYPWQKIYRNVPVQDFLYGAMENTTSTIFTDYYVQDERAALERNYIGTNAHELTHQWFGDLITEWSGTHHWLHESFATHYAKHFKRSVFGEDQYQWARRGEMKSAWNAAKKNDYPVAYTDAGSSRHYPKGSLVIDMLRYVVGEEQYKKVITEFLKKHEYDMVDTHLFYLQFMETLGINLDWFFEQWLYKGGEPHYDVSYLAKTDETIFTVEQTHELTDLVGYFKMPIVFQVHYTDGSFDEIKKMVEGESTEVKVPNTEEKEISFTLFDPNWNVLKTVDFEKTYDELVAQASNAPNMIDRHDAILALDDFDIEEKRKDLLSIYDNEDFYANKVAIIKQIANDEHKKTGKTLIAALDDEHHEVRRAVLQNMDEISADMAIHIEGLLLDDSYVTIELALKKLCKNFPEKTADFLAKTKDIDGHNYNIKITWLRIANENNMSGYLYQLYDFTSHSYEFRTRLKAMNAIDQLGYFSKEYVGHLLDATANFNRRLNKTAKDYLKSFAEDEVQKMLIINTAKNTEWLPNEQERIDAFLESMEQ